MDFIQRKSKILVTCALHVPGLLSGEMERFGKKAEKTLKNGVETTGTLDDCIRLNLGLRTAWRVLFLVDSFACRDVKDLHRQLKQRVTWNDRRACGNVPTSTYLT